MNGRPRRAEPLAGLFIAVAWAASTFAAAGLLAVVLDRDPVESDVPRLYGVIALVTAALWVWLAVTLSARSSRIPWPTALVAAAAVYFSFAVSGFVVGAPRSRRHRSRNSRNRSARAHTRRIVAR